MYKPLVIICTFFLIAGHVFAQSHQHDGKAVTRTHQSLPVTSIIRAKIDPVAQSVSGIVEINLRNDSEKELSQVYIYLPRSEDESGVTMHCHLDSLLYNGAPLIDSSSQVDSPILLVNLPGSIAPGKSGLFLVSFKTYLPAFAKADEQPLIIYDCFPRLCYFENDEWYIEPVAPFGRPPAPFTQLNLDLEIDRSYTLGFGGEVINEMEHIGIVPHVPEGKVLVDLTRLRSNEHSDRTTQQSEYSSYYVKIKQASAVSFAIGKKMIRDRVRRDSVTIDLLYSPSVQRGWKEVAASYVSELVHDMRFWLGDYPNDHLTIVAVDKEMAGTFPGHLLGIAADGTNRVALELELAIRIAQSWVPQYLIGDDQSIIWSGSGVGLFAAIEARADLFSDNSRGVLKFGKLEIDRPYANSFSLMWNYLVTPSWLYLLTRTESEAFTLSLLRKYRQLYRRKIPSSQSLDSLMREMSSYYAKDEEVFTRQRLLSGVDYSVKSVETVTSDTGCLVTLSIETSHRVKLPLEIAYVTQADTLFQQVDLPTNDRSDMTDKRLRQLSQIIFNMPSSPKAIILDPHHYLPEIDRSNNYWFSLPIKYRYHPPKDMFPTYHYLDILDNK